MDAHRAGASRRRLRRFLLVLVGLILSALALNGLMSVIARSEWDREVRRARDNGMPTTFEGLTLPEIPAAENAAVLCEEAFSSLVPPDAEAEKAVMALAGGWSRERIEAEAPLSAARSYLEANRAALELLHQAARRARCRYNVDWQKAGSSTFPHLVSLGTAASALRVEATVASLEGRPHDAVAAIEAIFHLAKGLIDEPWLMSCLVRRALRGLGRALARDVVRVGDLNLSDLERLDRAIAIPDPSTAWARGLDGECALLVYRQESYRAASESVADLEVSGYSTLTYDERRRWESLEWTRVKDAALCLGIMNETRSFLGIEYPLARERFRSISKSVEDSPSYCWMQRIQAFTCESILRELAEDQAGTFIARLALGVVRFHRERGRYPDHLDEMVPEFVPTAWRNPLTGTTFVYAATEEGFRLSSEVGLGTWEPEWTLGEATTSGPR